MSRQLLLLPAAEPRPGNAHCCQDPGADGDGRVKCQGLGVSKVNPKGRLVVGGVCPQPCRIILVKPDPISSDHPQ